MPLIHKLQSNHRILLAVLLTIAVFVTLGVRWWPGETAGFTVTKPGGVSDTPLYHEQFVSFDDTPVVHAPSLSERHDGKLIAAWYAGAREGAKDTRINSIIIDPSSHTLSPALAIADRAQTRDDNWRYIRKLGNAVIHQLPDGRVMLVYVSVSFGGWAVSNLNARFSDNGGLSWGPAIRLVTSPFINISTLVKGTPINLDNGNVAIPVYHEFMGKFAEMLVVDPQGNVVNKHRISWGRDAIQPVIVPLNANKAITLLRDSGEQFKRVGFSESNDSGQHWTTPQPLELPNPNAAVAAVSTSNGTVIMVFNNHEDERNDLTLAISKDQGKSWRVIHEFENQPLKAGTKVEFSYPYMIADDKGNYHLLYTWHKQRIKYIHFNQAWLEQLL